MNSFFLLPFYIVIFVSPAYLHQKSLERNTAKSKLYLRRLNHGCTREESARNEQLDKRRAKKAETVSHVDTRGMLLVKFEHMSREEITRISLNFCEQETP